MTVVVLLVECSGFGHVWCLPPCALDCSMVSLSFIKRDLVGRSVSLILICNVLWRLGVSWWLERVEVSQFTLIASVLRLTSRRLSQRVRALMSL